MRRKTLSNNSIQILNMAYNVAKSNGLEAPDYCHFLLSIIKHKNNLAYAVMLRLHVDMEQLENKVKSYMDAAGEIKEDIEDEVDNFKIDGFEMRLSKAVYDVFCYGSIAASEDNSDTIFETHILLALLKADKKVTLPLMNDMNITYEMVRNAKIGVEQSAETNKGIRFEIHHNIDGDDHAVERRDTSYNKVGHKGADLSTLDAYCFNVTKAAEEGKLDPVVGRTSEIDRIIQILSRRKKNNPILIGEPGVGKSAIVEGLASRIVQKNVPRMLFGKSVMSLDMTSLVAGTKYRGQFEERIKELMDLLKANRNIILFIDEIHTIIGAGGSSGSLDAANILKPALARGEIQCIGATTLDEYREFFEKDGALERRFQKVMVNPTTAEETLQILHNIKDKYEEHHNVKYTDEALQACIDLTVRYVNDRCLPDKAIDALDEAGSRVHLADIEVPEYILDMERRLETLTNNKHTAVGAQNYELAASFRDKEKSLQRQLEDARNTWLTETSKDKIEINKDAIAEVVSTMTGIPVQRVAEGESRRLLNMRSELEKNVIGQKLAIEKIVRAIQRNRAGLKDPNRPIGSFIFLGPTGVGKTLLAQQLASVLFGSADALIRIDMSEYMEKFAVSRLVGAPPGYVGHEEGGQLTEKVRRKPYAVILLDEIEKAHPDTFNLLLQVLDEGRMTDSLGKTVDFKNTIIIMTSNIGTRDLKDFGKVLGFQQSSQQSDEERTTAILQKALKKAFAPEFINRIDDTIIFSELSKDDIRSIIELELNKLFSRVCALGYTITISPEAKQHLTDKSYDVQYGARPLRRVIQTQIEDELAEMLLEAKIQDAQHIAIVLNDDKIRFELK